ncbi:MAG: hypothetical protein AAF799_25480 [Myxococcota bacterium]
MPRSWSGPGGVSRIQPSAGFVVGQLGGTPCQQALATAATTCGPWVYAWATGNPSGVEIATSGAACLAFLTNAAAACGLIFNG